MRGIPLFILVFSILWSPGKGDDVGLPDKSLTGRITDKNSGEAIPGVYIYIPDLKTGSVTDLNGKYEIHNLPAVKVLVQASYVGYRTALATIDLSKTSVHDFVMDPSAIEMNEVLVLSAIAFSPFREGS